MLLSMLGYSTSPGTRVFIPAVQTSLQVTGDHPGISGRIWPPVNNTPETLVEAGSHLLSPSVYLYFKMFTSVSQSLLNRRSIPMCSSYEIGAGDTVCTVKYIFLLKGKVFNK